MVLPMTVDGEQQHDEQLHQLVHDVRHCLNVVSMGTEILKDVREDDVRFAEVCESMEKERRKAAKLLSDYLSETCKGCD